MGCSGSRTAGNHPRDQMAGQRRAPETKKLAHQPKANAPVSKYQL